MSFELEPVADVSAPVPARLEVVSPEARERVTVEPAPAWTIWREVEETAAEQEPGCCRVLLSDTQLHAGERAAYFRRVQRLDTLQAIHEAGQWQMEFDPVTQWVAIHEVTVRRGGERFAQAAREKLRLLQREGGLERREVSGTITVVLLLEDVRLGDLLDVSYTVVTRPRLLAERYHYRVSTGSPFPQARFRLRLLFAPEVPMQWQAARPTMTPVVRDCAGLTEWTWSLDDLRFEAGEVRIPASVGTAPWFEVSDGAGWAEIAEAVRVAWGEAFGGPELQRIAQEIASAGGTLAERVDRALTFIQDEIRYLSDNLELGGQIPSAPEAVLRRRFGDCKDKAFLAAHLLRALGVPARPVLVHTRLDERVRQFLPALSLFDHAVIEYEVEGARRWADATLCRQGGGALSRPTPHLRAGLPIAPGVAGIEALPVAAFHGSYQVREHFRLDTTGRTVSVQVSITATGWEAEVLRRATLEQGAPAFARHREEFYRQVFAGAQRMSGPEWRDLREENKFTLLESFDLPNALQPQPQSKGYVFTHRAYHVQGVLGVPPHPKGRRFSLALAYPCVLEHHIELESPSLPREAGSTVKERNACFQFFLDRRHAFGRWSFHYRLETLVPSVPASGFADFRSRVGKIWPSTDLGCFLPAGIAVRPGRFSPSFPAVEHSETAAPLVAPSGAGALLAATPAPPLGSAVVEAPRVPAEPPPAAEARENDRDGRTRVHRQPLAARHEDEGGRVSSYRLRPRSHRRLAEKHRELLLLLLCVVVLIAITIIFSIRR